MNILFDSYKRFGEIDVWHVNFYIFRIEETTPKVKVKASFDVYHMDFDQYKPGFIIYTDFHSLKTSDGTTTHVIAGGKKGYKEGVGTKAKSKTVTRFVWLSGTRLVVVDSHNHCQLSMGNVRIQDMRMETRACSIIPVL